MHGDLTSLAPHERLLSSQSYHVGNTTLVPQLEKTHECPCHREKRAFFFGMAWRAIPSPISKIHRKLGSL